MGEVQKRRWPCNHGEHHLQRCDMTCPSWKKEQNLQCDALDGIPVKPEPNLTMAIVDDGTENVDGNS
eukprot:2972436-Prorocentrum_lima.AAC.1